MAIRVPRLGYKETSLEGWVQNTVRDPLRMPWPKPSSRENVYRPGYVPFSAADLFAPTDNGFYFDFSKTDRTFQESTGLTLADDATEPVGLALESRLWGGKTFAEVMAAQPNLVTDPGNKATYILSACTIDDPSGVLTITVTASPGNSVRRNVTVTAGNYYEASVEIFAPSANTIVNAARLGVNTVTTYAVLAEDAWTTRTARFVASGSPVTLGVDCASGGAWGVIGDKMQFRNLSLKEIPGNHAVQTLSTTRRPTRQADGVLRFDGVDDYLRTSLLPSQAMSLFFKGKVTSGGKVVFSSRTTFSDVIELYINSGDGRLIASAGTSVAVPAAVDRRGVTGIYGMTVNATLLNLWADATKISEVPMAGTINTTVPIDIGGRNTSGTSSLNADADIYKALAIDRALTPAEITKLVNAWS